MLRNFAVPLMPNFESKYRSDLLNCVQDLARTSWQGVSLYFAQKPGGTLVVMAGLTRVEGVGVRFDRIFCWVLDIVLELL